MDRYDTLTAAKDAVTDREQHYGTPAENFETAAQMINAVLGKKTLREPLSSADVVMIMIAVKMARLTNSPDHFDTAADIAGYAALLSEVV